MKILILSIYHSNEYYDMMKDIQRTYVHKFDNVDYYFVSYNNKQISEVVEKDDIIYIKGNEGTLNIINKTLKALEYLFKKNNYDYVIRTNISTIIHIPNCIKYINTFKNINYKGGKKERLNWLDINGGITHENTVRYNLKGLNYIQGNFMILSRYVVDFIIINKNKINYDIVDDVTIGLFIRNNLKDIYDSFIKDNEINYIVNNTKIHNNTLCIRNRSFINGIENRGYDIIRMIKLVKDIYNI